MEYNFETVKRLILEFDFDQDFDIVIAVANGGIIPAALINQRLGIEFDTLRISLRDSKQQPMYEAPILVGRVPNVEDKRVLLVEDRVKSGVSLAKAKQALERKGAKRVTTFAVNGKADYSLLDVDCFKFPWLF